MVRFKVAQEHFTFNGRVSVTPGEHYLFEHPNPFDANLIYRSGKYFKANLSIKLFIENVSEYERLYYAVLDPKTIATDGEVPNQDTYIVQWETKSGLQWRRIRQKLPYPSELRFLNGSVEFSLETESYADINSNMDSVVKNMAWGRSTMADTVYN
jgi:hypothetical protein